MPKDKSAKDAGLVHNLVRLVMLKAASQQEVEPDRIDFIDALRWLNSAKPDEGLPPLIVNTRRQGVAPRVKKHRRKQSPLMHRRRGESLESLLAKQVTG